MAIRDVRNIRAAEFEMGPGLNVFVGRNAQGKTSILEAVGLLARGRSFRTDDTSTLIRRGAPALWAGGRLERGGREERVEVELSPGRRLLRLNGREVAAREYQGHLEVVVYSTERLRVVRGGMRERRAFLDRAGAVVWPAYRHAQREYERVLAQRNAALQARRGDLSVWDEQLVERGSRLRLRRADYVSRLRRALAALAPLGAPDEGYDLVIEPDVQGLDDASARHALAEALRAHRTAELRAGRSLAGPHRDAVRLLVAGREASDGASSGQARGLLLALCLATLLVYHEERGETPVALLDDLDSELDDERSAAVCRELERQGQVLVTTAHPAWLRRLSSAGRVFEVRQGEVRCA
jgi:DNA replication and repair protein RecF